MSQATEKTILRRVYGKGRGWAFSQNDLADFGSRSALDVALHRLCTQGTIRRVLRGIYDYPRHSALLGEPLSPDIDQVAHALARKFGWRILPNGPSALNLMGLSTQVPAQYGGVSPNPRKFRQLKLGPALTTARPMACPQHRHIAASIRRWSRLAEMGSAKRTWCSVVPKILEAV